MGAWIARAFLAAAERVALQLPPRRAPQDTVKIPTILRAEGGQLQALVGRTGAEPSLFINLDRIWSVHSEVQ